MPPVSLAFAIIIAVASPPELPAGVVARIGSPEFRHPAEVRLLGTSADGTRVYTAGLPDGRAPLVFAWGADTGRLVSRHPLAGPGESIRHVGFGPDGVRVVVQAADGRKQFRILDPDTGQQTRSGRFWHYPIRGDDLAFSRLAWTSYSPDGGWMFRGGRDLRLYDTETGDETVIEDPGRGGHDGIEFADDGRAVSVTSPKGVIRVYGLPGGRLLRELPAAGQGQHAAGFAPGGKELLVWTREGGSWSLAIHDLAGNTRRVLIEKQAVPGRVVFAPDGRTFARVPAREGDYYPDGDWEIRDAATRKVRGRVPVGRSIGPVAFGPNGRTFYTQPGSRTIVPWDVATGQLKSSAPRPPGPVERFRFAADGKLVGLAGGFVSTWDPVTGKELSRVRLTRAVDWYGGAVFNPAADRLVFTEVGDAIVSWDFRTGAERRTPLDLRREPNTAIDTRFTADGTRHVEYAGGELIVRGLDGVEVARRSVPKAWKPRNSLLGIRAVTLSADGRRLAIGSDPLPSGGTAPPSLVAVLDLADPGHEPPVFEVRHGVAGLAFSPDGRWLVAGGRTAEGTVGLTVWDPAAGRGVGSLTAGVGSVNLVRFSPDGRTLAVSVGGHEARLVEVASWQVRAVALSPGYEGEAFRGNDHSHDLVAWAPGSRAFATATTDGGVMVWDLGRLAGSMPLESAWDTLASADAGRALAAVRSLAAAPAEAVAVLSAKLPPAAAPDPKKLKDLIVALDDPDFAERERAAGELERLGRLAGPALRGALPAAPPESRRRLAELLVRLGDQKPSAEELRAIRAVEVAEWVATPAAVRLLEAWAAGAAGARLTEDAESALVRIGRR
jgi:WD40 repeat protein